MTEQIIKYFIETKNLEGVGNYLEENSSGYGFPKKKGEEECVCFIDGEKRIFAILDEGKKEVKLAPYVGLKIIKGVEKLAS